MKIAIAQINAVAGNLQANRDKIIEQIGIAQADEADLLVLPEMSISGTPLYDLGQNEKFVEDALFEVSELAGFAGGMDLLVGLPARNGNETFNTAVHIHRGEIVQEITKAMPLSRTELGFVSGVESEEYPTEPFAENIITVGRERLFVAIGDDIDYIGEQECFGGSGQLSAVIHMDARRYRHGAPYEDTAAICRLARELETPVIRVNMTGGSNDIVYYGGSAVANAQGQLLLQLKLFSEELAVIDLYDLDRFKPIQLAKESGKRKTKNMQRAIVCGLRDYFRKRGFTKACLGLSGGIDSAVVLALACEALGRENVEVLLMPSQFSSDHSVTDAVDMANRLGITFHTIPIEPIYNAYMQPLEKIFGGLPFSVAEENLQARIRGSLLMTYANKFGMLLLNTSNKSEAAMGYGTLYGDTNGALSILGDLYKHEVYALANLINEEQQVIPQSIIDKEPSAELRPGQKDCDSLPPYEVLDKILYGLIEEGAECDDLIGETTDRETIRRIWRQLQQNEYKRYQLPPVLRLSAVTLGKERIMPF